MTPHQVKVGPKGRIATIPDGWYQVLSGKCQPNDQYADTTTALFCPVDTDDIDLPFDTFDCLIRKHNMLDFIKDKP